MAWKTLSLILVMAMAAEARILVHGHRGARALRPENTIPAFEFALEAGADVLELDLAVTKDGVLVVSHDPELSKPVCSGPRDHAVIHQMTLAEVREYDCGAMRNPAFPKQVAVPGTRMPTLDDVFALASRGSFEFNVETKIFPSKPDLTPPPDEFARLLLDAIRKHKLERRVIVQSFDYRTLVAMKELAPEIQLSALYQAGPRDYVELARGAGAGIVSPHFSTVTQEKVRAAHEAGLQVVPWTANRPADWERLVAADVDAIITDDPGALIEWLKAKGMR
jgi:glycerophosphoryl diester phosphodiesterase